MTRNQFERAALAFTLVLAGTTLGTTIATAAPEGEVGVKVDRTVTERTEQPRRTRAKRAGEGLRPGEREGLEALRERKSGLVRDDEVRGPRRTGRESMSERFDGRTERLGADEMALVTLALDRIMRRESATELKARGEQPDLLGPLAPNPELAMMLDMLTLGRTRLSTGEQVDIRRDPTPVTRAWLKSARLERGMRMGDKAPGRKVFIDGGGPAGALAAIHAFNHFPNLEVTIIEQRETTSLPIVWNNRQNTRNVLKFIDPVLEERVFDGHAGVVNSGEYLQGDRQVVGRPKLLEGDAERLSGNAKEIAASISPYQTQSGDEVSLYWDRLNELEKTDLARVERERAAAKAKGEDPSKIRPRLRILRGYQVVDLPAEGEQRKVVVQKVEERLQRLGEDGKPKLDKNGRAILRSYKAGDPVPKGWGKTTILGPKRDLGAPDDLLIAEGANSKTRAMAGAEFVDVGPATRFIAAFVKGFKLKSLPDKDGNGAGKDGVIRRALLDVVDPASGEKTQLKAIALSATQLDGTWALPEVPASLNFDDAKSIEAYFGKPLAKDVAVKTYYKQQIAPLLGVKPEEIPDSAFSFGPGPFVLQSHVAGPAATDASNVHLIGDARGNSHFLTSLGKVTGTGVHQLALNQYWTALAEGRSKPLATALLERRLDAGTRAWLKAGLAEFSQVGGGNLGAKAVDQIRKINGSKKFQGQNGDFKVDDQSLANDPTVNR